MINLRNLRQCPAGGFSFCGTRTRTGGSPVEQNWLSTWWRLAAGSGIEKKIATKSPDISRPPVKHRRKLSLSDPRDFHAPQSSYTKEDLIRSGDGGYFGPGNAQLPAPPMLMMDRITEISRDGGEFGKGHVIGELDIVPGLWFFDCH